LSFFSGEEIPKIPEIRARRPFFSCHQTELISVFSQICSRPRSYTHLLWARGSWGGSSSRLGGLVLDLLLLGGLFGDRCRRSDVLDGLGRNGSSFDLVTGLLGDGYRLSGSSGSRLNNGGRDNGLVSRDSRSLYKR
jgi:hypothetical protein